MVELENGLLPIVTFDASTTWDDVLRVASPHLDPEGLDRLKRALGQSAKSVVIERQYIDKDYRDTFANFHAKKFSTPDSRCVRLHFFNEPVNHEMIRNAVQVDTPYLGYSVIRSTRPNCIGRTLVKPKACRLTKGYVTLCEEKVSIQGTPLKVKGFPFISQDAEVTTCAQSALWMLLRYFSNRYQIYPETYPYRITALTRDYSVGRLFPTSGLYVWQMAEALRQMGFAPVMYGRRQNTQQFEHLMYTYVESGLPVLAAFQDHVVVLFGHVSDYSAGANAVAGVGAPFLMSSSFNKAFVAHDDNGTPYQVLPMTSTPGGIPHVVNEVVHFIAPLPERVFLPAEGFQKSVTAILSRDDLGYKALSPKIARAIPLLRLFLTTGTAFKEKLHSRGMGSRLVEGVYRDLPLPHFIWVCEISHLALYPDKVLGEVIWDATRNAYESDGWIALHYPEILTVDWGAALNGPQKMLKFSVDGPSDYPIYKSNLDPV